ncbi:hypothetical protein GALL_304040 [mine drainage metagenome]|uniref:Polyketide cyclase / dehydrase and lipid transport n=1 Tax=mine drainage metagenome TaxID=410659 RepID=A0A1J5QVP5_9ZZZZ
MRRFSSFTMVRQPVDAVWATMRDRLGEVAAAMEDLQGIELLECAADGGGLHRLNRWTARQKIPAMLHAALGGESIAWLDRAFWRDADKICVWSIEPALLAGHIECGGTTRYESAMAGRGTRVSFEGYFSLMPGFASALPAALEPAAAGFVESIVSTVIPRNLARAIIAAGELIVAEQRAGGPLRLDGAALDQPSR